MRLCPQQHRFVYIDRFFQLNKHNFLQPHMIIKHKLMRLAHGCCISRPVIGRFLPKFLCWGSCISAGTDDQDSSIKVTSWTPDDLDFKGNSHGFFPKREIYKSWNWHSHSIVPRRHSHQYITDGPCCHCFDLL